MTFNEVNLNPTICVLNSLILGLKIKIFLENPCFCALPVIEDLRASGFGREAMDACLNDSAFIEEIGLKLEDRIWV